MIIAAGKLVLGFAGWRFIPSKTSNLLLGLIYKYLYPRVLRRPPPAENSPQHRRNQRLAYTIIVFGYALYAFHEAANAIGPSYYELLGVTPTAEDGDLKAGFRAFAKRNHPDRAGPQAEQLFMEVRDAYDLLKDPLTRFAYDRFGPDALKWTNCTTMQDYIFQGLWRTAAYYVMSVGALFMWDKISPRNLTFWNYTLLLALFTYELWFLVGPSQSEPSSSPLPDFLFADPASPSHNSVLNFFWPTRVAFQHIAFLKSLAFLLTSALHQVIPALFPTSNTDNTDSAQLTSYLLTLTSSIRRIDLDVYNAIQTDLHSCTDVLTETSLPSAEFAEPSAVVPTEQLVRALEREVQDELLESILWGQNGPLRSACEAAVRAELRERAAIATTSVKPSRVAPATIHTRKAEPSPLQDDRASKLPDRVLGLPEHLRRSLSH